MMFAGRPMFTMLKRLKNSDAELQIDALRSALAAAEWRVLDERKVEVVDRPAREMCCAQRSQSSRWFGPVPPVTLIGIEKNDALFVPSPK